MAALSLNQEIALSVVTMLGSLLSLAGSSMIVASIIRQKKYLQGTYHRLLLGLSLFDISSSLGWLVAPFAMPSAIDRHLSMGTVWTCEVDGVLTQTGMTVALYNCCLSMYYLLTIRSSTRNYEMGWKESFMHTFCIGFALVTATVGVVTGVFNSFDIGSGCWVSSFPQNCGSNPDIECTRGSNARTYGYIFGGLPSMGSLLCVAVCNTLIYSRAKSLERSNARFEHAPATPANQHNGHRTTDKAAPTLNHAGVTPLSEPNGQDVEAPSSQPATAASTDLPPTVPADGALEQRHDETKFANENLDGLGSERMVKLNGEAGAWDRDGRGERCYSSDSAFSAASTSSSPSQEAIAGDRRVRASANDRKTKRSQQIAGQATCYVVVFANSLIWQIILRQLDGFDIITEEKESEWLPLIMVAQFFLASAGAANLLIYTRPRYLRLRKRRPELGRVGAFGKALSFRPGGTGDETRRFSNTRRRASSSAQSASLSSFLFRREKREVHDGEVGQIA